MPEFKTVDGVDVKVGSIIWLDMPRTVTSRIVEELLPDGKCVLAFYNPYGTLLRRTWKAFPKCYSNIVCSRGHSRPALNAECVMCEIERTNAGKLLRLEKMLKIG